MNAILNCISVPPLYYIQDFCYILLSHFKKMNKIFFLLLCIRASNRCISKHIIRILKFEGIFTKHLNRII